MSVNNIMSLAGIPADFSSVYGDLMWTFTGRADGNYSEIVVRCDRSAQMLGVKKIKNAASVDVNLAPYGRRLPDPVPFPRRQPGLHLEAGRTVRMSVAVGNNVSSDRVYICSRRGPQAEGHLMRLALRRRLHASEHDEFSVLTGAGVVRYRITLSGNGAAEYVKEKEYAIPKGMVLGILDMPQLLREATAQTGSAAEDYDKVVFRVSNAAGVLCEFQYDVFHGPHDGVRLAWMNSLGAIEMHTFAKVSEAIVEARAGKTCPVEVREMVLSAGVVSERLADGLADLMWTDRLWRVQGDDFIPLTLADRKVAVRQYDAEPFVIRVREERGYDEYVKYGSL